MPKIGAPSESSIANWPARVSLEDGGVETIVFTESDIRKARERPCAGSPTAAPDLALGMKVFVYFNVRLRLFSIKALEGESRGRVVHHASTVEVLDATFKVSEAGRQRVLKEKRKNVHAGIVGTLGYFGHEPLEHTQDALVFTYNPYKMSTFCTADGTPVHRGRRVVLGPLASYVEGSGSDDAPACVAEM